MKKFRRFYKRYGRLIWLSAAGIIISFLLYINRLGSIPNAYSFHEMVIATGHYGWHGLYHNLLFLPINVVRSAIYLIFGHHGRFLTRLPDALFGIMTVVGFAWLLRLWHGNRTAIFGTVLFATSAWTLHVSRLATNDVMYLWAMVLLLVSSAVINRYNDVAWLVLMTAFVWVGLLFIPGMIWLLLLNAFWQRDIIMETWKNFDRSWVRPTLLAIIAIPSLVLLVSLVKNGGWILFIGLPAHLASPLHLIRNFFAIPYHLFIHGPLFPELWLARLPLLDLFTAVMSLIGLYFYATNIRTSRSKILGSFFIVSLVLIALNGPVSISLIMPIMYGLAATGIAYLLREWLSVFPINPFARNVGIGIIVVAITLASVYNLRAYFVAWPHAPATQVTFRYQK